MVNGHATNASNNIVRPPPPLPPSDLAMCGIAVVMVADVADDLAFKLMEDAEHVFRLALAECRASPGREHPFAAVCFTNVADCARYDA